MKPSDFKETDKQPGGMPPCVSTYEEDIPQWALNLIIEMRRKTPSFRNGDIRRLK